MLFTRATARAAGLSDDEITGRLRSGRWSAVRRGLLHVEGTLQPPATREDLEVVAAVRSVRREVVVGLAHAARLWGLPTPLGGCGPPVLLARGGAHRNRDGVRVVVTPLAEEDVVRVPSGLLVTSLRRTATDCLRCLHPPDALAVADAAARRLHPGAFGPADLDRYDGWPGVVGARRLAGLVDPRRESALESWTGLTFATLGMQPPTFWQADVHDDRGFVGRGDAWWSAGVLGECDGRSKYRLRAAERGGADADTLESVLHDERRREARLRRGGLTVVRWGAADVLKPVAAGQLVAFLRQSLRERTGRSFRVSVTPHPL